MSKREEPTHSVKRITLPSGKTIEVVHFFDGPAGTPPPAKEIEGATSEAPAADAPDTERPAGDRAVTDPPPASESRELHICLECDSPLVYPTSWHEADAEHWHVTLRCPSCECCESGTFSQQVADRFDEQLERGTEAMIRDLKRLTRANMAEEIDRFVTALDADAIQPMDF
ncbi:MAG: hypothetical protein M3N16_02800 [Actinomycetota bacterium]|nr:hypothetical protein [Actinomycetota bacterium]